MRATSPEQSLGAQASISTTGSVTSQRPKGLSPLKLSLLDKNAQTPSDGETGSPPSIIPRPDKNGNEPDTDSEDGSYGSDTDTDSDSEGENAVLLKARLQFQKFSLKGKR